jgi:hypothetical protein
MIRLLCLVLLAITVLTPTLTQTATAAPGDKCKIGRPAYCYKHGGSVCEKYNTTNAVQACSAWTSACLDCHTAVSACLGDRVRLRSAPICSRCDAGWHACMRKIDSRYWPTRGQFGR